MRTLWLSGMIMAAALDSPAQSCRVEALIDPGMALPNGMLIGAQTRATEMFREIGVDIEIRTGAPGRNSAGRCGGTILIQFDNTDWKQRISETLAYAKPYQRSGVCIRILIDRVRDGREPAMAIIVLAHVIVHEITHVLQGIARHSDEGMMKPTWSAGDYMEMRRHSLPFAAEDIELIQQGIKKRSIAVRYPERSVKSRQNAQ